MYREREYYSELLKLLQQYGFSEINHHYKLVLDSKIKREYTRLKYSNEILTACEDLIGKRINSVIPFHAMLYRLIRTDFGLELNDQITEVGIHYTLYGCVIDKILDDEKTVDKDQYIKRLEAFSLGVIDDKDTQFEEGVFTKLGNLINHKFLTTSKEYSNLNDIIVELSKRAIDSEIFVSQHDMYTRGAPRNLFVDKSDKFTMVGILLALMDVREEDRQALIECAQSIGTIFLLIDDLSDLYEDIENKQINSLVVDGLEDDLQLEKAIDHIMIHLPDYVIELKKCMNQLELHLSRQTLDFVHFLIVNWLLNIINYQPE